jgi:hypothetical protein
MMNEAEMDMTKMAMEPTSGVYEGDQLSIKTYVEKVHNKAKSKEAGRPIYEDLPHMAIRAPGSKDTFITVVGEIEKKRYYKHWNAFVERQEQVLIEGTPLEEWSGITRSEAEELKFFKIHTVEQLAGMSDTNAQNFRGMNNTRRKAQAYLAMSDVESKAEAVADATARVVELEGQNEELAARLKALEESSAGGVDSKEDLAAMVATLVADGMAKQAPKPKRKRRSPAEMAAAKEAEKAASSVEPPTE